MVQKAYSRTIENIPSRVGKVHEIVLFVLLPSCFISRMFEKCVLCHRAKMIVREIRIIEKKGMNYRNSNMFLARRLSKHLMKIQFLVRIVEYVEMVV